MTPEDQDCIAMLQDDLIYNDPLYQQGFQAGATSQDVEFAAERKVANQAEADAFKYGQEIVKLRTQINVLLEAMGRLEKYVSYNGDTWVQKEARNALSTAPEQSIAAYRNKVIEECAAVLNVAITRLSSCGASIKNDVAISTLKEQSCRLRAMKEQP